MPTRAKRRTAFGDGGFHAAVDRVLAEIIELYQSDKIPWVVGYSGGKDSSAVLQLVWMALARIPSAQRTKPVHVISTDTLVENPIVAAWVTRSIAAMAVAAPAAGLPITPHRLTPKTADTFWVNLIGKGYPAPRHKFRWCTERLKILPSNSFIRNVVAESGEAILVLGTRKAESAGRAHRMAENEKARWRENLSPNTALANCLVYTPIDDWQNDDVWLFLMQVANPWGHDNHDLLTMYQGASADGECPLVVDTSTPSCGDSRFGCWTCTLVDQDKSMTAMIQNDEEKEWMLPLLELRNELDIQNDRPLRDFRRMTGLVQLFKDRPIPGPYKQKIREQWLEKLLRAQQWVREHAPAGLRDIELITMGELEEIRRIWVVDKHEIEDALPAIYERAVGKAFPGTSLDDNAVFRAEEMAILREVCGGEELHFQLSRELLDVERRFSRLTRRSGLFEVLDSSFKKHFFDDEADATDHARRKADERRIAKEHSEFPFADVVRDEKSEESAS